MDNVRANVGRLYFAGEATSRKYFGEYNLLEDLVFLALTNSRIPTWSVLRGEEYGSIDCGLHFEREMFSYHRKR